MPNEPKRKPTKRLRQGIYIDKETDELLDAFAEELGMNRTDLTRQALNSYLKGLRYRKEGYEFGAIKDEEDKTTIVVLP